jgi:hypothetical protein
VVNPGAVDPSRKISAGLACEKRASALFAPYHILTMLDGLLEQKPNFWHIGGQ